MRQHRNFGALKLLVSRTDRAAECRFPAAKIERAHFRSGAPAPFRLVNLMRRIQSRRAIGTMSDQSGLAFATAIASPFLRSAETVASAPFAAGISKRGDTGPQRPPRSRLLALKRRLPPGSCRFSPFRHNRQPRDTRELLFLQSEAIARFQFSRDASRAGNRVSTSLSAARKAARK